MPGSAGWIDLELVTVEEPGRLSECYAVIDPTSYVDYDTTISTNYTNPTREAATLSAIIEVISDRAQLTNTRYNNT